MDERLRRQSVVIRAVIVERAGGWKGELAFAAILLKNR